MKADFSGYATKAGLRCSDGLTIMPDAFKHQDQARVPLVWQHGHSDPENVLGHAILENRPDGVYTYGFFNSTAKAAHTRELLEHRDITMLSIWANQLIKRSGQVLHGAIREVSLVLSGANPGALIENVTIRHSDGEETTLDDEVIIYTGLELEHTSIDDSIDNSTDDSTDNSKDDSKDDSVNDSVDEIQEDEVDLTVQDVYDSMTDEQREVVHMMLGEALSHAKGDDDDDEGETVQDVYDSMSEKQKQVLHFMIGEALESAKSTVAQDNMQNDNDDTQDQEGSTMANVFEKGAAKDELPILSHADMQGIFADAMKSGSLKDTIQEYALSHGIENIDVMFPDAQSLSSTPEVLKRRNEWVAQFLGACRKSPFSRTKTINADLTLEEARAKGYVKGALKKEEFFGVTKRITTPTTIYKKQKLDRDDVIDITDFDVIVWLKGEMRYMLDEELARAILISDGRDVAHEDKINEGNIRPISKDHELYVTTINVNVGDASSSSQEIIDAIITNRRYYRGTGVPTMYTSELWISKLLLIRDTTGRRIYKSLAELALELRVNDIVSVDVMEEEPDLIAVIVNPVDYVIGADKGGQVNMFDDFDIDYNAYKYLIETRCSGALVKLKSGLVVRSTAAANVLVTPTEPSFVEATGVVTIPTVTGVVYKNAVTEATLIAGAQAALAEGATLSVVATPEAGYYFATSEDDQWSFTRPVA